MIPNNTEYLNEKQKELFVKKSTRIADSYLKKVEMMNDTIEGMKPFYKVLKETYVDLQPDLTRNNYIGTYCIMVPEEIIYAANAIPLRLCSGHYTSYSIGDDYVPRDACPLVKAIIGSYYTKTFPVYEKCLMTIVPSTCDCKKKWQD